jgi:hypothetical protein
MDTEPVSYEEFRDCLAELAQVNGLTFAYRPTLRFFDRLLREGRLPPNRAIVVVDAGSGYGDMGRKLDAWATARGVRLEIVGVDMNPWSARAAAEATDPMRPLSWKTCDVFDYHAGKDVDIVVSALFTHHLPRQTLVRFLRWMEERAAVGWFINDLERHPLPYYALKFGFWATRRHRFMRHDGPVSIASAFKKRDWIEMVRDAGLPEGAVEIRPWLPFRLCVSRVKHDTEAL